MVESAREACYLLATEADNTINMNMHGSKCMDRLSNGAESFGSRPNSCVSPINKERSIGTKLALVIRGIHRDHNNVLVL